MTPSNARCWAEIDAQALADNVRALCALGSTTMAVVKADAYGHGVALVLEPLLRQGIRHFGVATVDEGRELRDRTDGAGTNDSAIYIMAAVLPEEARALLTSRLVPFVSDFALAQALSGAARELGREAEIHVEVDTGIGRAGIDPEDTADFVAACRALPGVLVSGICTHFTAADSTDASDCARQYARFEKVLADLPRDQVAEMVIHAANSPAALRVPDARLQLIRPGLLLYGIGPNPAFLSEPFPFRPVLSLKARALLVRRLAAGTDISYGRTYTLPRDATIATIGLGYGDGFPRRLSNKGYVLLPTGERAPIRGRVCMDQTCVELPNSASLRVGDTVTAIGKAGDEEITVTSMADQIDTTAHEITTCLTARIPRILANEQTLGEA